MTIYKNRYQANKFKRSGDVIVKVDGGYIIISEQQYQIFKNQK